MHKNAKKVARKTQSKISCHYTKLQPTGKHRLDSGSDSGQDFGQDSGLDFIKRNEYLTNRITAKHFHLTINQRGNFSTLSTRFENACFFKRNINKKSNNAAQ